jgi:hypothetical protein
MENSARATSSSRALPAVVTVLLLAPVVTAEAHAAGAASELALPQWLSFGGLLAGLPRLLSIELLVGFALGLFAGEAGRIAWTAGLGAWKALLTFGTLAARYGVIAGLLGAVLYFV